MSTTGAPTTSRGSYFDLYPDRKPKPNGGGATAPPSASPSNGKSRDPLTGNSRSLFTRASRQGSISSSISATSGKEKEREREPTARRPSATPSFFAKAFGSNADAKRDAALGLRRGPVDQQWTGGGLRRESAASVASSSSSSSRSGSQVQGGSAPSSAGRQRNSIVAGVVAPFPSARSPAASGVSPIASTSSLDLNAFDRIPDRSSRSRASTPNSSADVFPLARRPGSVVSSRSSSSHPFPPALHRTISSSTSTTHSSNSQRHYPTDPLDFDSAMDALFDSQDRPERPRSNLSGPSPRSSLSGYRPISNVFPSPPASSVRTGSVRSVGAESSLRHRASLASIPDAARDSDSIPEEPPAVPPLPPATSLAFPSAAPRPPSPEPTAAAASATSLHSSSDVFAGPSETRLQFDQGSQSWMLPSQSSRDLDDAVKQAEGGVEALVASLNDMGRRRSSATSAKQQEEEETSRKEAIVEQTLDSEAAARKARNREITADSLTSDGSFASMTAGPSEEQQSSFREAGGVKLAPVMDRDANATVTPDSVARPIIPSIEDILKAHGQPSPTDDTARTERKKSWGMPTPSNPAGVSLPAVSAVPFPPSTPRRKSSASSASSLPHAPPFSSASLPPLRYGPSSPTRSPSPPPPRHHSPPPPLPTTRSPQGSPPPTAVEFSPPAIDPSAASQPTRIKTIEEIIREHSGTLSPSSKSKQPSPAQVIAAAARSKSADEGEPRESVDSVADEILVNLELQSVLEREERETVERTRKSSKSSLGRTFSLRLPRSASSSTGLDSTADDKADTRSIKSTRSAYGSPGTPRATSPAAFAPEALAVERELAILLKSSRLTRIVCLRRAPNQGLSVSLADVGSPTGHPVIVFLGLGCVRYLVALYEEMAEAFDLRLICLDRWGLGRTSEVADDIRGFVEWASVVEEVAEQLQLSTYSLLAHSAGSPYALATALRSPSKVQGSIHLLAPWISTSADSLAGAYRMLKYIPSGVIKSAQAAEWKMQAWRLGKPPTITHAPIGYDQVTGSMLGEGEAAGAALKIRPSKSFLGGFFNGSPASERVAKQSDGGEGGSLRTSASPSKRSSYYAADSLSSPSPSNRNSTATTSLSPRVLSPSGLPMPTRRASVVSSSSTRSTLERRDSETSLTSPTTSIPPSASSVTLSGTELANGLLRASYAESLRGGTSDLMVILERTSKPWGFKYGDVQQRVKVWHGDKDERISMSSVKGLEVEMRDCQVIVVEGADHSLMTNGRVMVEVLESISAEARQLRG